MIEIKFIRKPAKTGEHPDDYSFKIPRNYIYNGLINRDKYYEVICREKKEKD